MSLYAVAEPDTSLRTVDAIRERWFRDGTLLRDLRCMVYAPGDIGWLLETVHALADEMRAQMCEPEDRCDACERARAVLAERGL